MQIGWTALHLASATGQLPMVQMLVEKGGTDLLMAKDSTVRALCCVNSKSNEITDIAPTFMRYRETDEHTTCQT